VNINNNNSGGRQTAAPCPPANQNNIYDPRVPPAGVYRNQQATPYTTGEKKPYITDNNCNNNQPFVVVTPP